jgi:hypothetical protein
VAVPSRPALAWRLDVPLSDVWSTVRPGPGVIVAQRGSPLDVGLSATDRARELGRSSMWTVHALDCPP